MDKKESSRTHEMITKKTANGFTPEQEEQILRETEEAVQGKRYSSAKEAHDSILSIEERGFLKMCKKAKTQPKKVWLHYFPKKK